MIENNPIPIPVSVGYKPLTEEERRRRTEEIAVFCDPNGWVSSDVIVLDAVYRPGHEGPRLLILCTTSPLFDSEIQPDVVIE